MGKLDELLKRKDTSSALGKLLTPKKTEGAHPAPLPIKPGGALDSLLTPKKPITLASLDFGSSGRKEAQTAARKQAGMQKYIAGERSFIDRLNSSLNYKVNPKNTIRGYKSGVEIDANYGRTPTSEPKNLHTLSDRTTTAQRAKANAQTRANISKTRAGRSRGFVTQTLENNKAAAEDKLSAAKAAYNSAKAEQSAAKAADIRAKDLNKRAAEIRKMETAARSAPDFATGYTTGKKNNAKMFADISKGEQGNYYYIGMQSKKNARINYMTEAEKNVYAYWLDKDPDTAENYYDALSTALNHRYQTDENAQTKRISEQAPALGTAINVASSFTSPLGLAGTAAHNIGDVIHGEETPIDPNSAMFTGAHGVEQSAEGIKENTKTALGDFLVDTGLSMAQFASKIPLGPLALPMMASGAGGQTALEVTQRGGTAKQALGMGLLSAAAEYVTEKMSFDSLRSIYKNGGKGFKNAFQAAAANVGKQSRTEFGEELTAELLNNISDELIMGDNSQMQNYIEYLLEQGYSREEALRKATTQFWIVNPMIAGAGGALSGGVMGTFGSAAGNYRQGKMDTQSGTEMRNIWGRDFDTALDEIIATGQEYSDTTGAGYYSDKAKATIDSGKELTDKQVGRLYRNVVDTQAQEAEAYFNGEMPKNPWRRDAEGYLTLPMPWQVSEYEIQKQQYQYAQKLAGNLKQYGVKNVVVEHMPEGESGRWENGTVYVSSKLDTAQAINTKVAHEISHAAKEGDAAFTTDVITAMNEAGKDIDAAIGSKLQTYQNYWKAQGKTGKWISDNITEEYAADEVVADYIGELMQDDIQLQTLTKKPNIVHRILDTIDRLIHGRSEAEQNSYTTLANKLRSVAGVEQAAESGTISKNDTRYDFIPGNVSEGETKRGISEVASMEPVAEVDSKGFQKGKVDLVTQVVTYFNSIGNNAYNPQLGDVALNRRGAKSDIAHGIGRKKAAAFAAVPNIIEHGKVIDFQENWKNKKYDTAVIAAPITIDGEAYIGGVVVERTLSENSFYLHEVYAEKADGALPFKTGASRNGIPSDNTPSIINLLQKVYDVKRNLSEDPRYSLDDESGADIIQPWEETERQAQEAGYPFINDKQVFPYKTWVKDLERENYGLVVGLGSPEDDGTSTLRVSFWNKDKGIRAVLSVPVTKLTTVTGTYQPSDAELSSLFKTEPPESLRSAVSYDDWIEYSGEYDRAMGFKPGTKVKIERDDLPIKAQKYLARTENRLVGKLGNMLDVPRGIQRNFLRPIAEQISQEYLETGSVSDDTIDNLFETAWSEGVKVIDDYYNEYKDLKSALRTLPVSISKTDVKDITDYGTWKKHQFGKLNITNDGLPVDIRYQELGGNYPEMFPEDITHPADQLRRMAEIADSIHKIEVDLDHYYGKDAEFYEDMAKHDFKTQMMEYLPELSTVRKYYENKAKEQAEREKVRSLGGMNLTAEDVENIKQLWENEKDAKRKVDKAVARNLMSADDNELVRRMLVGEITESSIPESANFKGIKEVYEARAKYESIMGTIRDFNRNRKAALRYEADDFLKDAGKWKDKSAGWKYQRETMERNIRDIASDNETADAIIKRYFEPVHKHEADRTRVKNLYRSRVESLNLDRKVRKGNSVSEASAVQILGEAWDNIEVIESKRVKKPGDDWRNGHTLTEWRSIVEDVYVNNPNIDLQKVTNAVEEFRSIYNELFELMNSVRIRNGYEPVNFRRGYFPHFQNEQADSILAKFGKALGINITVDELPTSINGITHTFRPGIRWTGSSLAREGYDTLYDAVEGFDRYIEGVSDVICHTDDIQSLRALGDQIRYRSGDEGLRERVDEVRSNKELPMEERENNIRDIYENGKFTLSNFIVNLEEYTNLLANKKAFKDRNMERDIGRKSYDLVKALENRVAANMVAVNPGSWLTNFIPLSQGGAQLKTGTLLKSMWDTLKSYKADDGFAATSDFLTNRAGSDPLVLSRSNSNLAIVRNISEWNKKATNTMSRPMEWIDMFTAESLVRARYEENRAKNKNMSEELAMDEANSWTAGVMADRSKGSEPTLFEAKNPVTKLFTQFQLEVNNQLSYLFKDIPREEKEKGLAVLAGALLKFFVGSWLYNEIYEYIVGRRPALDPIGILNDTVGDFTGYQLPNSLELVGDIIHGREVDFSTKKETLSGTGVNLTKNIAEELPFVGGLLGGGRLPISSALPNAKNAWNAGANLVSGEGSTKKNLSTLGNELIKPAAYVLPPFGGGQLKKMYQGIRSVIKSGVYGVDGKGNSVLKYPVYNDTGVKTAGNFIQSALFGPTSLEGGQDWIESGFKSLNAKQTAVYSELVNNGTPERAAYNIVTELQKSEKTDEKTKSSVQRDILSKSKLTPMEKDVVYYGIMATDEERAVMEKLDSMGSKYGESFSVLSAFKDVETSEDKTATAQKREILTSSRLSSQQKQIVYEQLLLSGKDEETQKMYRDVIGACTEGGMSFDDYLAVGEAFEGSGAKSRVEKFIEMTGQGVSGQSAAEVVKAIYDLEPEINAETVSEAQKVSAIAGLNIQEREKIAAVEQFAKSSYNKVLIAAEYNISVVQYSDFYNGLPQYDADGNGSYRQAEVRAALDANRYLTNTQKAVLFQIKTRAKNGRNNPYSSAIGAQVEGVLKAEKGTTNSSGGGGALAALLEGNDGTATSGGESALAALLEDKNGTANSSGGTSFGSGALADLLK